MFSFLFYKYVDVNSKANLNLEVLEKKNIHICSISIHVSGADEQGCKAVTWMAI